jgi:hypothetical protein
MQFAKQCSVLAIVFICGVGLAAGCHGESGSKSSASASAASDKPASAAQASASQREEMPPPAPADLNNFLELARRDIQLQKASIIADNMTFTNDEAADFWPIYREYESELYQLNNKKLDIIRRFLPNSDTLTDDQAKSLAKEVFTLDDEKTALKRKYFSKFQEAIPATKTARFFQIENQLNMIVDLRTAAALPLIK